MLYAVPASDSDDHRVPGEVGALSDKQAQRDLQALTEADLLKPVGRTKGRHYLPGPAFPATVLETADRPLTLTDPYDAPQA
ncbi:hypothetical protein ACFQLX_04120 [Streptomyces polyrhachis]|uniref:Uncharacterized protein n=1 Tax=Streptomyces polyrhachis TaxID=1282885 RepID=A0ABW2GBY0_9ACTN